MISVVVPVYNVECFITKCITSLVNQTYVNFEVIVVDDGSMDSSIKIAREITANDRRFSFFRKENGGLSSARNFGVAQAKYDLVCFLDSDDFYHDDFLKNMLQPFMENNEIDISICAMDLVRESGDKIETRGPKRNEVITGLDAFKNNLQHISISSGAQNKLYKKELVLKHPYPEGLFYEDRATTYKLLLDSNKVALLAQPMFYYLQRDGSIMNSISQKKIDDHYIVFNSIVSFLNGRGLGDKYTNELYVCYFLNVIVAPIYKIASFSSNSAVEITEYLNTIEYYKFSFIGVVKLLKFHPVKFLSAVVAKILPSLFVNIIKRKI